VDSTVSLFLIRNGTAIQKSSIIHNFKFLFHGEYRDGFRDTILPQCLVYPQSNVGYFTKRDGTIPNRFRQFYQGYHAFFISTKATQYIKC
jgi:hypothetical protein